MFWNKVQESVDTVIEKVTDQMVTAEFQKELKKTGLELNQKTALNDGTPVTVEYAGEENKIGVINDLTGKYKQVDRSEIAEPEPKKSGWFW